MPETFKSVPTHQLEKLISSISELKGYLLTQPAAKLDITVDELSQVIEKMKHFIVKLDSLNDSKDKTNQELSSLENLSQQWLALQTEMLKLLDQKFSIDTLYNSLFELVNESKQLSVSISSSFINAPDPHSDSSIESFINTYRAQRSLYHLRNSKLQRFKENRIGGLYL